MLYLFLLFIFTIALVLWLIWFVWNKAWQKGLIFSSLNYILLEVRLPKIIETIDSAKEKEKLAVMEQFYNSLNAILPRKKGFLKPRPYLVFEIAVPENGEEIFFHLAVPKKFLNTIQRQLQGFFPEAEINAVNDYNIFNRNGKSVGSTLRLKRNYVLPFQTYKKLETNTLGLITNAISLLEAKGEGVAIQILVRPTSVSSKNDASKIIKHLYSGKHLDSALGELDDPLSFIDDIKNFFNIKNSKEKEKKQMPESQTPLTPLAKDLIDAIDGKAKQQLFETNIRILASAETEEQTLQILSNIESAFAQFEAPDLNYFYSYRPKKNTLKKLIYNFSFRLFNPQETSWLSGEELTSVFHLPIVKIETPKVRFLKSKAASPPAILPSTGVVLGKNEFRDQETLIKLSPLDRRRHLYIIGQTGTGKSYLLRNLIKQDIDSGAGVGIIDPHGDLVEAILGLVPQSRLNDVILFDPADTEWPVGLNLLEASTATEKDFAIQEIIAIFQKLFLAEHLGPIFEHSMRNAMLTLMADEENPGTLVDIPRIFTDPVFVRQLLIKVTDPLVRDYWEKEMLKMTEQYKSEMLGYLISKIGRFVENSMMRNIIGQTRSGIDFDDVINNGKILLVNLSKGRLGEINSALLGLIITAKLQMAAFKRAEEKNEEMRRDFYLYMDEFQNFATDSIATTLSEARKYRLNLILAHQFIAQLTEKIRDSVFGNVGSIVSFRIGPDDAKFLVKQFEPIFNESDLINIDNRHAYAKLLIGGATTTPFNFTTETVKEGSLDEAEKLRELNRQKYARPRTEVEEIINKRFKQ
ncbi:MAG: type IV secretion system DNA-binding domain-containing protein [Candidatus Azambacteria bacterium]|nr:type IV secretion system DNA-binding domain-containing protein [Candidatus Azambacteria bacterium]